MSRRGTAASKLDSQHGHNNCGILSKCGVWTGCGQRQCTPSRQQVARNETEEPLLPYPPLHFLFSLQIGKVSAACSCCRMHSHWTVDWTGLGAATPVTPQGLEGSTPWCTRYDIARNKQGITASSSLTCSKYSYS